MGGKFYDLALVDKHTGSIVATFAGMRESLEAAKISLAVRAEGKIPFEIGLTLRCKLFNIPLEHPADTSGYGFAVRSSGEVQEF